MSTYPDYVTPTLTPDGHPLTFCARPHRGTSNESLQIPVVPGTELCAACHASLKRTLIDVMLAIPHVQHAILVSRGARDNDRVSTSGHGDVSALWNPTATSALHEIADWTSYIARVLITQTPSSMVGGPLHLIYDVGFGGMYLERQPSTRTLQQTGRALAYIAHQHATWLTHYPGLGPSWVTDAINLRNYAQRAEGSGGVTRVTLRGAHCEHEVAELDADTVLVCDGQLVGIITDPDSARPSRIMCAADPSHRQTAQRDWLTLQPAR
ncbi:hypothetical protein GRS96_12460 [Rathayibacter sp. VKM Ac-2803]|uniref:hypothetical protein n=1 Tax=Rathayibacter sp. VKM Ac-2803 TaxID=2609256 RepID=UPI00135B2875|nr:hypothetical protein [Rathayibacter sp. VKM Ac-2803]MWV50081.1 hypothetical protein [Rathayibacter sp. VKM Ac-2803]